MIEVYITNLGKYNEGILCGEYLKLPAEMEDVKSLLSRIGVDGVMYEETFITDYETDIEGLCKYLGEYESVDELNYLASIIEDMDDWEIEKFEAAIAYGERTESTKDLINLAQNLDCYDLYREVSDEEDLGRYYIDELCMLEIPEHIEPYFDYEAYGRDIDQGGNGVFLKGGGYITNDGGFIEHYSGRDDLPDEYKIFAYPDPPGKMPIAKQIEMYKNMVSPTPIVEKTIKTHDDRM